MKMKSEFLVLRGRLRKDDLQIIVAADAALLEGHAFVLKKARVSPCSPETLSIAKARAS